MNNPMMGNPMMMQFNQFMQQMRGQNPSALLNQLLQSGKVSQQQINQAHQQAKQLEAQFASIRKNFGF